MVAATEVTIKPSLELANKWSSEDKICVLCDDVVSTQLSKDCPTITYNNRELLGLYGCDLILHISNDMGQFKYKDSYLNLGFFAESHGQTGLGYLSVTWKAKSKGDPKNPDLELTGDLLQHQIASFEYRGVKFTIVFRKADKERDRAIVEVTVHDLIPKTTEIPENKLLAPFKNITVKPTRVKVFALKDPYKIWISQGNVTKYEANATVTLNTNQVWIEAENSRSFGSPDIKGEVYRTNGNKMIDFKASNPTFARPWFSIKGIDGVWQSHSFDENETWVATIDSIRYKVIRLPDGDGCKLFQMYVDA